MRESGLGCRLPLPRRAGPGVLGDVGEPSSLHTCGVSGPRVPRRAGSWRRTITWCVLTYLALSASSLSTALGVRPLDGVEGEARSILAELGRTVPHKPLEAHLGSSPEQLAEIP